MVRMEVGLFMHSESEAVVTPQQQSPLEKHVNATRVVRQRAGAGVAWQGFSAGKKFVVCM